MKQNLILLSLFILVPGIVHSQLNNFTRLPVQNPSQSINESACLWLSENEMMIFYVSETMDTIYLVKSSDRGITWNEPDVVTTINLTSTQESLFLNTLKSNSGRLMIIWSIKGVGMNLIYSDDSGENWSAPILIYGAGGAGSQESSQFLRLSQLENGNIILAFNRYSLLYQLYYRVSTDDGISWSTEVYEIPRTNFWHSLNLQMFSSNVNEVTAIYQININSVGWGIFKRTSTDNGTTWSDTSRIINVSEKETNPRLVKTDDGNLWLTFERVLSLSINSRTQSEIYYLKSTDAGISWSTETQLTKSLSDDINNYISSFGDKVFCTFSSNRSSNKFQVYYGILDESMDVFTPPLVFNTGIPNGGINYEDRTFVYQATVLDDHSVRMVKIEFDDSALNNQLYDDGLHNDAEANDSIYGNKFSFPVLSIPTTYAMETNNITLPFNNKGIIADVIAISKNYLKIIASDIERNELITNDSIYLRVSNSLGQFDDVGFLFSSGFYLSGYSNGTMFSNAVASASLVEDYLPGVVGSNPEDLKNIIYVVNKDDAPFGYSWQKWKDAVSLGADFYDGDGDGIYNPVDKNWNGTWDLIEDMPMLIGDETAWCVYNDGLPTNQRRWQSDPQGIDVRQTIFASDQPELKNVIFIRYAILNTGTVADLMDSVYFGIWEDPDLGDANDDLVGCDTLLQSGYVYNYQDDLLYGANPPSFFTTFLQGPILNTGNIEDSAKQNYGELIGDKRFSGSTNLKLTSHVFQRGGDPVLNDPYDEIQARNCLIGRTSRGDVIDPCTFQYCEVRGGVDCHEINPFYWASGDPVANHGWLLNAPVDQRNLISTGPFQLEKEIPQEIIIAYVLGRGTDPLNSITVARENVQRAIEEYESNFASMTYSPPPATNPVSNYVLYQNYPNPFNPGTTIRYELPQDGVVTIDIFNILGQKVKTLLNEFKKTDRYEVTFNGSGLASGVYIYQLRVNDFITSKKMLFIK